MAGGDEEFYVSYFQPPGRAEAEIEPDVRGWLRRLLRRPRRAAPTQPASSSSRPAARMRDRFPGAPLPAWLTEAELDDHAQEFERTGLTGALNRYRNVDRDWDDLAAWHGDADHASRRSSSAAPSTPPSPGSPTRSTPTPTTLPGLAASHLLDGCGHWVQQERPDEVNDLLVRLALHRIAPNARAPPRAGE